MPIDGSDDVGSVASLTEVASLSDSCAYTRDADEPLEHVDFSDLDRRMLLDRCKLSALISAYSMALELLADKVPVKTQRRIHNGDELFSNQSGFFIITHGLF